MTERLRVYYVWTLMEEDARKFVKRCPCCANYKTGLLMPGTLSETVHGAQVGAVVLFHVFYPGESEVAEAVDSWDELLYLPVIVEDLSNNGRLHSAWARTANFTATELVNWCSTMGTQITWVSDNSIIRRSS